MPLLQLFPQPALLSSRPMFRRYLSLNDDLHSDLVRIKRVLDQRVLLQVKSQHNMALQANASVGTKAAARQHAPFRAAAGLMGRPRATTRCHAANVRASMSDGAPASLAASATTKRALLSAAAVTAAALTLDPRCGYAICNSSAYPSGHSDGATLMIACQAGDQLLSNDTRIHHVLVHLIVVVLHLPHIQPCVGRT